MLLGLFALVAGAGERRAASQTDAPLPAREAGRDEGRFALQMRECPRVSEEDVRRVLRIEVGELLLPAAAPANKTRDSLSLTIRCARSVAWVEATGSSVTTPLAERLFLDELPADALPRALALAGLELLAATSKRVRARLSENRPDDQTRAEVKRDEGRASAAGAGPALQPTPAEARPSAAAPPGPASGAALEGAPSPSDERADGDAQVVGAPPALAVTPAREGPRASRGEAPALAVGGVWRAFRGAEGLSAGGAWAGLDLPARGPWALRVNGEVLRARRSFDDLGQLGAWLVSVGASFAAEARRGPLAGSVALGWRQGLVRWSGESDVPRLVQRATVWRAWGGPLVALQGHWRPGRIGATLGVEMGRALWEAEGLAFGAPALAVRGFWTALWLGAELGL